MVQQFTRLGNCRRRERNTSPMGLERAGRERRVMARDTVAKHNTHSALRIEDKRERKQSKVRNVEESEGGS